MPYTPTIEKMITELQKLPGIGPKSAQRLAYYLLKQEPSQVQSLSDSISGIIGKIHYCENCNNFTEEQLCSICSDDRRDLGLICVVEQPFDILSFERTGAFKGLYHCLLGALSPIDGITPENLRIQKLVDRIKIGEVREVILGTNPDTEGEATANYLIQILKPLNVPLSRLGVGIPIGGDLEYTDQVTLSRAFEGRRKI
jgi:recombination protein RecR